MSVIQIIIISAAIILCTLIIGFLFPFFDSIKEKLNDRNININDCEIFNEAIRLRRAWKSISQRWLICDYMFKIIPFECTSIILYLETFAPDGKETALAVFGFSIISMIVIILPFAVRPYDQMKAYRKAYLIINSLIYLFISTRDSSDEESQKKKIALAGAIELGERYINKAIDIENPNDNE